MRLLRPCAEDGCPEPVPSGKCPRHRPKPRRSPSSTVTGTAKWRRLKARLLAKPEYRWCHYCGDRATTLDHVRPVSHGGAEFDPANLVPSCKACNDRKGGRRD